MFVISNTDPFDARHNHGRTLVVSPHSSREMLRSATILALAGAASAQTWNTDADSCTAVSEMISCDLLGDDECTAAKNCEIATTDSNFFAKDDCMPVAAYADVITADFTIGQTVMEATIMSCAVVLDAKGNTVGAVAEADCTGLCEWTTMNGDAMCGAKDASTYSAIVASGANAGTKGFLMYMMQGNVCDALETQETCEANKACDYDEEDESCDIKPETMLALVKNKCLDDVDFTDVYTGRYASMAEVYAASGVPDESSPAKLQEAKEDAREAAGAALAAAAAKETALFAGITDETDKKKAAVLTAAAAKGGKAATVDVTISAETADDACTTTLTGMALADAEADAVFCTAAAARRRALLASNFAVEIIINTAEVNSTAAVAALKVAQPTVADTVTETQKEPLTVLATIDGVDSSSTAFTEFKTAADSSAALEAEASTYETESAEVNVAAGLPAEGANSAASSIAAVSAIATAALAAAACVFA